jgi:hypothetical protein
MKQVAAAGPPAVFRGEHLAEEVAILESRLYCLDSRVAHWPERGAKRQRSNQFILARKAKWTDPGIPNRARSPLTFYIKARFSQDLTYPLMIVPCWPIYLPAPYLHGN